MMFRKVKVVFLAISNVSRADADPPASYDKLGFHLAQWPFKSSLFVIFAYV